MAIEHYLLLFIGFGYTVSTPCERYHVLEMYNGLRHIEAERSGNFICDDNNIYPDYWYRLLLNGENFDVADQCQPLGSCNTFAPIWMIGGYPDKAGVVNNNTLCSNYGDPGNCTCHSTWADGSKKVDVQLCENGHGGDFFIHRFDRVPGCNAAVCVQNRTTNKTEFEGNNLSCDKEVEDCSSITVVLNETLTDLSVECVFVGVKSITLETLWVSESVVQCPVPTVNVTRASETINGLYSLNIVQTADPTDIKQKIEFLLFDSTCEICDETFGCVYKNGTCVVNGWCLAGSVCDGTTEAPSTTSPTTDFTASSPTTDHSTSTADQTTTRHEETTTLHTQTEPPPAESTVRSTTLGEAERDNAPSSSVLLISTLTISLFTLCLVTILIACYWKRAKHQRQIDDMSKTNPGCGPCPPSAPTMMPGSEVDQPPPYSPCTPDPKDLDYEIPVRHTQNIYENPTDDHLYDKIVDKQ